MKNLAKKVKLISTKGFTKDSINRFGILNGEKNFPDDGLQNHSVFQAVPKYFKIFTDKDKILHGNPKVCQNVALQFS